METLISTLQTHLPSIYSFQMQVLSGSLDELDKLKPLWSFGKEQPKSSTYANDTNFKDCTQNCFVSRLVKLPDFGDTEYSLFWVISFETEQTSSSAGQYQFLLTYITWIDLISIFLVFCLICYLNLRLMSNIYYTIFSQMNLFTHTLERYSNTMFSPQDQHAISVDNLLFREANELSDFFLEYFSVFRGNKDNNCFDMTDSIEKVTSQLKQTMVYRRKFDENVDRVVRNLCMDGDFGAEFNRRVLRKPSAVNGGAVGPGAAGTRGIEEVRVGRMGKVKFSANED